MRTRILMMAAVSAAAMTVAVAMPAAAVPLQFVVIDPNATVNGDPLVDDTYRFFFDSDPTPAPQDVAIFSFTLQGTAFFSTLSSSGAVGGQQSGDFTFFLDPTGTGVAGGLSTPINFYGGPQLFTGTPDDPTFLTGPFALTGGASITIGLAPVAPAPVPEPAGWALMVAGFGLVGAALRARPAIRARVRFA